MEDDDASFPFIMKEEGSSSSSYTATSSKGTSTWTSYLVDFITSETNTKSNENLGSCISGEEMNMVVVDDDDDRVSGGKNLTKMRKFQGNLTGLRLKKRIVTRKSVEDEDELDDTASSPTVNCSPKVNLENMEVESADQKYTTTGDLNTKVCGFSSPLGKKGLCLVPVSILHIYKDK